jgi:predicted dehydrogenase
MRVLVIGLSSVVRRRVLPALVASKAVTAIDVASRHATSLGEHPVQKCGALFDDYSSAIASSEAQLVYVSTVNAEHAAWARAAIDAGRHVVVDKPTCTSLQHALDLVARARARGVCLAEALVYGHHPQIAAIRSAIAELGASTAHLTAMFTIPPLPVDNYRYRTEAGGGALLDQGPYAVSIGRLLGWGAPLFLCGHVDTRQATSGVDTSFSLCASYGEGRSYVGHFGFTTDYENSLQVLCASGSVSVRRVFSTDSSAAAEVIVRRRGVDEVRRVDATDSFRVFLEDLIASLENREFSRWTRVLEEDARALAALRKSCNHWAEV